VPSIVNRVVFVLPSRPQSSSSTSLPCHHHQWMGNECIKNNNQQRQQHQLIDNKLAPH
jgi:hypothetical protein